ncbi:hypothetical protein HYPSUDRAFT_63676 [Hypholoma sublateritium FD-334 SS-4]|uniref:NADAR domain-containing protein n=1 Tax=Hypholoma sublateritium (strain FD-334 SS-4) TaxID=945553 RepID=A0A0D2P7G9_HYPSF|nr:hypothetical protein HYPSUDRAFT_63676 [Hypholoma sublateritium FD-334 SS-4]
MYNQDDYVFFWKVNEIHGWGSQWYRSPFKATVTIKSGSDEDGATPEEVTFPTAEHWMMFQKAVLFNDTDIAREILETPGTTSTDMAYIKSLGRKVKAFDNVVWEANRERIVLEGNLLKFRQIEALKAKLLATGDKVIVEASPRDRIWGVGFGEKNALNQRDRWGLNLLGKALQETRRTIREEMENTADEQL